MRSIGLLVGEATLRRKVDGEARTCRAGSGATSPNGGSTAYLSGFRIVLDEMETRHAEYRVLLEAQYERWHRFSEIKRLTRLLPSLPTGPVSDGAHEAWRNVRSCKAPQGRALDARHLSRKCHAIEGFISALVAEFPAFILAELLSQVPMSPRISRVWSKRRSYGTHTSPRAHHSTRTTGTKLRMF